MTREKRSVRSMPINSLRPVNSISNICMFCEPPSSVTDAPVTDERYRAHPTYGTTAEADETGSSGLQMEGRIQTVPADSETNSSTPRTQEVPASLEPSESSQGASNVTNGPETDSTESSQGDVQPNTADLDSSSDASGKSTSNFMVPFLDTDEVFAFYCVATGKGEIPNAFEEDEIVRYPDKNCVYIYVSTQHFTQTGCENLLRLGGFTIHNPINLPKTDAGMPYGLVVIYQYQQR